MHVRDVEDSEAAMKLQGSDLVHAPRSTACHVSRLVDVMNPLHARATRSRRPQSGINRVGWRLVELWIASLAHSIQLPGLHVAKPPHPLLRT